MSDRCVRPQLVLLHWLMAALVLATLAAITLRGALPSGHPWRPTLRNAHYLLGQMVLGFVFLRIAVRWRSTLPPAPGTPRWTVWAGHSVHALLYVAMLVQPLLGVLFMQAGDKSVSLAGWTWPTLAPSDPELHFRLKDAHVALGLLLYGVIALHVAAALWHHVVRRDDTLRRMLRLRAVPAPAAQAPPASHAGALASRSIEPARRRSAAAPVREPVDRRPERVE